MPLAADQVGIGYEVGLVPVSGLDHIASGPAISIDIRYLAIFISSYQLYHT